MDAILAVNTINEREIANNYIEAWIENNNFNDASLVAPNCEETDNGQVAAQNTHSYFENRTKSSYKSYNSNNNNNNHHHNHHYKRVQQNDHFDYAQSFQGENKPKRICLSKN